MIYESTQEKEEDCRTNPLCYKTLCGLGIATSIDALAVGISLACHRISHCTGSLDDRDRHLPILRFWCLLRQPLQPQDRPQTGPDRRIDPDRHRHQNPDRASLFQWISHHFTFTSSQTTISQLFPVNPVNAPQGSSPLYKSKPAPPPSCLSIKTP